MRIIKPTNLGVLSRPFEFARKFNLGVSVIAFMPISEQPLLLSETSMWDFLGEVIDPAVPLDIAIPKQRPEFIATATAYAPEGRSVTGLHVGIKLGSIVKTLYVSGVRHWRGQQWSSPEAFVEMPVDWPHTYGGVGFAENPSGKGHSRETNGLDHARSLPNIMGIEAADSCPGRPAGFAGIDLNWPQRADLAGTYDEAWLNNDFPGFPSDIDWRFFNIAPQDQQFSGPLLGTELYAFENLHPERRLITGSLPGLLPRLLITRKTKGHLEEIPLNLTTVWFFPDRLRVVLIHHGCINCIEEDASDIELIMVGADRQETPRHISVFEEEMLQRVGRTSANAARALDDSLLVPKEWLTSKSLEREQSSGAGGIVQARLRARQLRELEKTRATLMEQGLDPDKYLPLTPEKTTLPRLEELPPFIDKLKADAKQKKSEHEASAKRNQVSLEAAGVGAKDLGTKICKPGKGPPSFTAAGMREAFQTQVDYFRSKGPLPIGLQALLEDDQRSKSWQIAETSLRKAYLLSAHMQESADKVAPARSEEIRRLLKLASYTSIYDLHGVELLEFDFSGRDLSGICFDGANLQGSNFEGAFLKDAVLAHANLSGCSFKGANLCNANLGGADLTRTSFVGARLKKSILTRANLTGANFENADLGQASIGENNISQANFTNVNAPGIVVIDTSLKDWFAPGIFLEKAVFLDVDLSDANLVDCVLTSSRFIGCKLDRVNLVGSNLCNTAFVKDCSLRSCQFSRADLKFANFRDSVMSGSDFTSAVLEDADFSGTDLSDCDLSWVMAKRARFVASNMTSAIMYHGSFMNADLTRADLRGANLTDCGLYEANVGRVLMDDQTITLGAQTVRLRYLPRRGSI